MLRPLAHEHRPSVAHHQPSLGATQQFAYRPRIKPYETTISDLRRQFDTYTGLLRINLESYTALQVSVISTLQERPSDSNPIPATVYPLPQAPFDTPHNSDPGHFPFYAVRRGRTTGIFNCWADCHRSIHRTANEYRGFHNIDDALEYINQAPLSS